MLCGQRPGTRGHLVTLTSFSPSLRLRLAITPSFFTPFPQPPALPNTHQSLYFLLKCPLPPAPRTWVATLQAQLKVSSTLQAPVPLRCQHPPQPSTLGIPPQYLCLWHLSCRAALSAISGELLRACLEGALSKQGSRLVSLQDTLGLVTKSPAWLSATPPLLN